MQTSRAFKVIGLSCDNIKIDAIPVMLCAVNRKSKSTAG